MILSAYLAGCGRLAAPALTAPRPTAAPPAAVYPLPSVPATAISPIATPSASPTPDTAVFYVAPDGDDAQDGSAAQPWRTIAHAVTAVPDGGLILVRPGTYLGQIRLERQYERGITIRSERPYQAQLRHDHQVIVCFVCQGVTIEGFDIAHSGPGAERYVIQIQDEQDSGRGGRRIILRNNLLHDSYNNDILKINNGAQDILVAGNMFYNQSGQDSHIDLTSVTNVTIQDNIFFNDFAGSGRVDQHDTGSFLVIKDANREEDGILGSHDITVRRNLFFNWSGEPGSAFITLGDNSPVDYFQAYQIVIENNLLLGNAPGVIHTPLKITGGRDIVFRNNTITGDLPAKAFAVRLVAGNLPNTNIAFYNNIWADPTGTMGAESAEDANDLADTTAADQFVLMNNLYWNGGQPLPEELDEPFVVAADSQAVQADPGLPTNQSMIVPPRWDGENGRFSDGSPSIRAAFIRLVRQYGRLSANSAAIGAADPRFTPVDDIEGQPRKSPDIGAAAYLP